MIEITTLLAIIPLVVLFVYFLKNQPFHLAPKYLKALADMPGSPILHNLYVMYAWRGSAEYAWKKLRKYQDGYRRLFKMWIVHRAGVFLKNPEDIEVILSSTTNITKGDLYDHAKLWLNEGLVVSTGDHWRLRRKLLTPAFHFNILKQFIPVIDECSHKAITDLESESEKESSDIIPIVSNHTLQTICETTMGISVDPKRPEIQSYKDAIDGFGGTMYDRLIRPWLWNDYIMWKTDFGRSMAKRLHTLKTFTRNVINARLDNWKSREVEVASGKKVLPMLDLLIHEMKKGEDINYDGICEEVDTFMFEGHDTTSMAISFMLMLLANNPECQERIYEEQISIFGNSKRLATSEDLQEMTYLERCIKESLRLYPSVPIIARCLEEDMVLKDYVVPATLDVYVLVFDLHHNPEFWPNPNKFDPDRFLPELCAARHPFAYIPFSAGPRNCIGQKFAMLEMKSFVGKMVREYVLEPVDTPESLGMRIDLVIRPSTNIRVKIRKRN